VNAASDAASPQVNTVTVTGGGAPSVVKTDSIIISAGVAVGSPAIGNNGVVSAAGFVSGATRGSIATIFGTLLANGTASASTVPLPRTLANVQVSVNGVFAPLFYVSPGQINLQIPFEAPLQGTVSVTVIRDGVSSSTANIVLAPYAPAIFTYSRSSNTVDPVIVHSATGQIVTPADPAIASEFLTIYGTGLGDLSVTPQTGDASPSDPVAMANMPAAITIGGVPAIVSFTGLAPGLVGLAQINVQVPKNLPADTVQPLIFSVGPVAAQTTQLYVGGGIAPLSITTASLYPPTATVGMGYSAQQAVTATGGTTPYSWSAFGLPNGVGINSSSGAVFGTPTVAGTFTFTVTVTDSSSPQQMASKTLSIDVGSTAPLSITTASLASVTVGTGYAQPVVASGGQTPYTWSVSSGLPSGLAINSFTGAVFGTPTVAGTFNFTVTVTDSSSPQQTASKALSITVASKE
jgi:uncharacterized protein (TIGR03437 family)